jgi:nucleotide-binding universal stress UspA family protein
VGSRLHSALVLAPFPRSRSPEDAVPTEWEERARAASLDVMLLLCATDTSMAGDAALRVSTELAARLHAELAALDADTRDPTPRLLSAARATGCDLLVLGFTSRAGLAGTPLPGWQQRVVHDAPCPVMLVPVDAVAPRRGGVVLGYDVPGLPHQAAYVAGRLAGRLRAPLIITHVLPAGVPSARPTRWQPHHGARVLAREAAAAAGGSLSVRYVEREGRPEEQLAEAAASHEAALVVIGGRGAGRTLLPRRPLGTRLPLGARLPIVVAASPPHRER